MTDYRTVPVEPDDKIIRAMCVAIEDTDADMEEENLRDGYDYWRPVALAAWSAALSASPAPASDLVERIDDEWRALFGDGPDSFANPGTVHYDEFVSAIRAVIAASPAPASDLVERVAGYPVTVDEHLAVAERVLTNIVRPTHVDGAVVYSMSDDVPEDIAVALSYVTDARALIAAMQPGVGG